jgi:nickel-dependent lactate racemase
VVVVVVVAVVVNQHGNEVMDENIKKTLSKAQRPERLRKRTRSRQQTNT